MGHQINEWILMLDSFFLIAGYTLLAGLSLFSVWLTDRHKREHFVSVFVAACISIFCLALANRLTLAPALLLIFLMLLAGNIHRVKVSVWRVPLAWLVAMASLALAVHAVPGFDNYMVVNQALISSAAHPINMFANIDKAFSGVVLLLLATALKLQHSNKPKETGFILIPVFTLVVLVVAYLTGLDVDIKLPEITLVFILCNLIFSVIAEEAFFRAIIQNSLIHALKDKVRYSTPMAIVLASLLFGLAHIGGGWHFVILATFAGLVYGYAYHKTGRISVAILTHLSVNLGHFLLLVYPVPK